MCYREEESSSWRGRGAWGLVSVAGIGLSWVVSVTFPYFSTVMAIIAALGDLAGAYALPALFVLVRIPSFMVDPHALALPCAWTRRDQVRAGGLKGCMG